VELRVTIGMRCLLALIHGGLTPRRSPDNAIRKIAKPRTPFLPMQGET
jgi:hypothetical protein